MLRYFLRRQQLPQMRLVSFFCATFFTPKLRLYNGNSWRIRRRRFGGVAGIHSRKPLKLFDTFFQRFDAFFQFSVFLFQLLYLCVFVHGIIIGQKQRFTSIIQNSVNAYVYFAMGSSGKPRLVADIIEGFRDKPYRVIAPIETHIKDMNLEIPSNVIVTCFLPAHKVNPMADISVIHGGQNTVMNACLSGTPIVGVGMHPERQANLDACYESAKSGKVICLKPNMPA